MGLGRSVSKATSTVSKDVIKQRRKNLLKGATGAAVIGGTGYALSRSFGGGSDTGSSKKEDTSKGNNTATDTGTDDGTGSGGDGSGTGNLKSKVKEVPIDNYEDALAFANREWNKIKRENGHTLECQVQGSGNWQVGEWCKVYMPSFSIDDYMYIIRTSQSSEAGEWSANLSLMDYPPGWGKEELKSDESDSDSSSSTDEAINTVTNEIKEFKYSNGCSDGNCIKANKQGDCHALSEYIYNRLKELGVEAKIYEYKTGSSNNHWQVKYNNGTDWVMFPYSQSGIDHTFYTNSIPDDAKVHQE